MTLSLALSPGYNECRADVFGEVAARLASANTSGAVSFWNLEAEKGALRGAVAPADPEVEFEYLWPSESGELNRWSVGVSQELPDFRKIKATGRVVSALDAMQTYEERSIYAENLFEAEKKLIEYIGAKKDVAMLQRIHENFDSLSVTYQRAWERGEVTILDLNKIKIEHARASSANDEADGNLAALEREIIALSGGTLTAADLDGLEEYPVFMTDGRIMMYDAGEMEAAVRNSPQFKALEAKLGVADAKINLASKARFPQFSIGYVHAYEDGSHFNGLSAGMTLPVFSRNAEKASAQGEQFALKAENEQELKGMIASVQADCSRARALKGQLDMLGPVIENTNNVRLLKLALDGGEISLLDYLQEISYFTEAAREYNSACLQYALTRASISRYMGRD